jgi:hypothetical protein
MTKAGHSLAWRICLLLAFCHWIDARRPDEPATAPAAETTEQAAQ